MTNDPMDAEQFIAKRWPFAGGFPTNTTKLAEWMEAYASYREQPTAAELKELEAIVVWVEGKCAKYPEQAYPLGKDEELPRIQRMQCAMHQVFHKACAGDTWLRLLKAAEERIKELKQAFRTQSGILEVSEAGAQSAESQGTRLRAALEPLTVTAQAMIDAICEPRQTAYQRERMVLVKLDALCDANDAARKALEEK